MPVIQFYINILSLITSILCFTESDVKVIIFDTIISSYVFYSKKITTGIVHMYHNNISMLCE